MVFWCLNVKVAYCWCCSRSQLTPGRWRGAPWMSQQFSTELSYRDTRVDLVDLRCHDNLKTCCVTSHGNRQNISVDISVKPQDVWLTVTWRFVYHLFGHGERWQPSGGSSVGGTEKVLPSKCYLGKSIPGNICKIILKHLPRAHAKIIQCCCWTQTWVQTWFEALLKGYSLNLFSQTVESSVRASGIDL